MAWQTTNSLGLHFASSSLDIHPFPRESEIDFLTEAEAVFAPPQLRTTAKKKEKKPTVIQAPSPKKTAAKKKDAA
jgi:hypothetical protein